MAENTFERLVRAMQQHTSAMSLDEVGNRFLCSELDDIRGKMEALQPKPSTAPRHWLPADQLAVVDQKLRTDRCKLRVENDQLRAELAQHQTPPAPILAALNELEPGRDDHCDRCAGGPSDHIAHCSRAAWELLRDYLRPPADAPASVKPRHLWRAQGGMTLSCQRCFVLHDRSRDQETCPGAPHWRSAPPKDEPFRPGLPPAALRKAYGRWEAESGYVYLFSPDGTVRGEHWTGDDIPNPTLKDISPNLKLRPHARTWLSVQTAAAEMIGGEDARADRHIIDLPRLGDLLGLDATDKAKLLDRLSLDTPGTPFRFTDPRTLAWLRGYYSVPDKMPVTGETPQPVKPLSVITKASSIVVLADPRVHHMTDIEAAISASAGSSSLRSAGVVPTLIDSRDGSPFKPLEQTNGR